MDVAVTVTVVDDDDPSSVAVVFGSTILTAMVID